MGKRAAARRLSDTEASAKLNSLKVSPTKLNIVAGLIRGLKVNDALVQLQFCNRRVSNDLRKLLSSAIANAENNHNLDIDNLIVKEVRVGKSLVMKRFHARGRGRGARILKPFSKAEIVLSELNDNDGVN